MYDMIIGRFGDSSVTMLGLLVFLATGTLTFALMAGFRVRGAVKRRAAGIRIDEFEAGSGSLRHTGSRAARRVIEYTNKHYNSVDDKNTKVLRRRLVQAGYFDPRAVAYFFLGRTVAGDRLGAGDFHRAAAARHGGRHVVLAVCRCCRHRGLSRAEPLSRQAHRQTQS